MEILRQDYLNILEAGKDKPDLVKVLTGMRRTGKSVILNQFMNRLKESGVDGGSIFYVNMDLVPDCLDYKGLDDMMSGVLSKPGMHYIAIDEIQNVDAWERSVAMLVARRDCDIYITGSNSKMLSSELSTLLSGRYIEIHIQPFSFKEYMEFHPGDKEERFKDYLRFGSLPVIEPSRGQQFCDNQLEDLFNTVLVKDILARLKTDDISKIVRISRFLYSNIGNITNTDTVAKELGISNPTVEKYIHELLSAHLFYHSDRYDFVGKKILKTNGKYYATDLGMRRVSMKGIDVSDISRPIKNIVFLELIRRGYTVRTGSFRDSEIDFTATREDRTEYFQVTQTMMSEDTKRRELSGLKRIRDNYTKTVLTMDRFGLGSYDGIEVVNLIDWLLG